MKKFSQRFVFALAGLGALALPQVGLSYTGSAPEFSPSQENLRPELVAKESCDGDVCRMCDPFTGFGCEESDDAKVIMPSQPVLIQPSTADEEPSTPSTAEDANDDTATGTTSSTTYTGAIPVAENFGSAEIGGAGCSLGTIAGTSAFDSGWLPLLILAGIHAFRKKK